MTRTSAGRAAIRPAVTGRRVLWPGVMITVLGLLGAVGIGIGGSKSTVCFTAANGLVLPVELVRALSDGRWTKLGSSSSLAGVFGSEPVKPRFHSLKDMVAINDYWENGTDPFYLGQPDPSQYPGDIDPKKSLIVAELRPDQLIALDYRAAAGPQVIFASDDVRSPWRLVFESIESLLLGLAPDEGEPYFRGQQGITPLNY